MNKLEKNEEQKFVNYVKEHPLPAIALKLKLFVGRGWPDRTVFCDGKLFFIEFKKEKKGVVSPQQRKWKKLLKRLRFNVYICTSHKEAIKIFQQEIQTSQIPTPMHSKRNKK